MLTPTSASRDPKDQRVTWKAIQTGARGRGALIPAPPEPRAARSARAPARSAQCGRVPSGDSLSRQAAGLPPPLAQPPHTASSWGGDARKPRLTPAKAGDHPLPGAQAGLGHSLPAKSRAEDGVSPPRPGHEGHSGLLHTGGGGQQRTPPRREDTHECRGEAEAGTGSSSLG